MPKIISAEPFNWLAINTSGLLTDKPVIKDLTPRSTGALRLGGDTNSADVGLSVVLVDSTLPTYDEYGWQFTNYNSQTLSESGACVLRCDLPTGVYRKHKIACGMKMDRTTGTVGQPVSIYIENGQWGSGWYGFTSSATTAYVEVVVDFATGEVICFLNNTEVVRYTFTKRLDTNGDVDNNIYVEFGNSYNGVMVSAGVTSYPFWVYGSKKWYASSYYMTYAESASDDPRLGTVKLVAPKIPSTLTVKDLIPGGSATDTSYSTSLGYNGSFGNPSSVDDAFYTTSSGSSSIRGAAQSFTSSNTVIGVGVKFMALSADTSNKAKVKLSISDGETELISGVQTEPTVKYSDRVESDPVIMVANKETSTASTLSYSMAMA